MPELPEVETVVRLIRPRLVGRTIRSPKVYWRRTVGDDGFERNVRGRRILEVRRRAKYILIDLDAGLLVGHLRMTGRMHVEAAGFQPGPHTRVSLGLDNGDVFQFLDVRKFGRLIWAQREETALPDLGPEPLGRRFTPAWLRAALRARRRVIKPLLLDQAFVAGLGNIYVDETLHLARIHPCRSAHRIGPKRATALHHAIRTTLQAAIRREGSSFDRFYRTPEGRPGSYQLQFRVYGRAGQPCPVCGTAVRRIQVASRGTHLCPRCQRRP